MKFISNTKGSNHKDVICELIEWADKCILCTSFFDVEGFNHLSKEIIVGLENRNLEITIYSNGEKNYTNKSAIEAVSSINGIKHRIIAGKRRLHSKIYYFEKSNDFAAIIGSANITHNGLVKNIEFSTRITGYKGSFEHKEIITQLNLLENEN